MKIKILNALLLFVLVSCNNKSNEKAHEVADYAITNVTLIDGTGKDAVPNTTILIKDERILKIV